MTEWLTIKQVAELTGLSPSTIKSYNYLQQMPNPDQYFSKVPVWDKKTIEHWDNNRRKLVPKQPSKEGQ